MRARGGKPKCMKVDGENDQRLTPHSWERRLRGEEEGILELIEILFLLYIIIAGVLYHTITENNNNWVCWLLFVENTTSLIEKQNRRKEKWNGNENIVYKEILKSRRWELLFRAWSYGANLGYNSIRLSLRGYISRNPSRNVSCGPKPQDETIFYFYSLLLFSSFHFPWKVVVESSRSCIVQW